MDVLDRAAAYKAEVKAEIKDAIATGKCRRYEGFYIRVRDGWRAVDKTKVQFAIPYVEYVGFNRNKLSGLSVMIIDGVQLNLWNGGDRLGGVSEWLTKRFPK